MICGDCDPTPRFNFRAYLNTMSQFAKWGDASTPIYSRCSEQGDLRVAASWRRSELDHRLARGELDGGDGANGILVLDAGIRFSICRQTTDEFARLEAGEIASLALRWIDTSGSPRMYLTGAISGGNSPYRQRNGPGCTPTCLGLPSRKVVGAIPRRGVRSGVYRGPR